MGDDELINFPKNALSKEDITINPEELISYFTSQRTLFDELLESFDDTHTISQQTLETYAQKEQHHAEHIESKIEATFPNGIPTPEHEQQLQNNALDSKKQTLEEAIQTLSMGLQLRWTQNIDIKKRMNEHYTKFMKIAQVKGHDTSSIKLYNHFVDSFNASLQNIQKQVQSLHFTTLDEKSKQIHKITQEAQDKNDAYIHSLKQFTEYYGELQTKKETIQQTIQKGKGTIASIQDTEKLIAEEQEALADATNELERSLQKVEQQHSTPFQHLLQILTTGASDVLENIVSDETEYKATLSHVLGAIDQLPLHTINSFKEEAETYTALQRQQTQLHTDVKSVLEELCAHFRGYHSLIEETETIVEDIKRYTDELQEKHKSLDDINEKYRSLISLTAEKVGLPKQQTTDEYHKAFEHTLWNNVHALITQNQLSYKENRQKPKQKPAILTYKQLSSADEEYAANVASLMLRFADIEIAEEGFWKSVHDLPSPEQEFYHLALPPTFASEERKDLETERTILSSNQDTLSSYFQKIIDEHEDNHHIKAEELQAIDKKFKKVLGEETYKEIYKKVQSQKYRYHQRSRYTHLVKDKRLQERILLFEAYDQEAQQAMQTLQKKIDISNSKTKSPLHMLYELFYPENRDPTSHLFIRTKNDHENYLAEHNTDQTLARNDLAAIPLFSDYGYPDRHYRKDPNTGKLEKAQFFIDLRKVALVTYYITTTQHRWFNAKEITNAYLDDFRRHKTKPLYDEINDISTKIGTLSRTGKQDSTIDNLEKRREQLNYEAQKFEQAIPKGIYYSPIQRFYYHLSQHMISKRGIQYRIIHPAMDEDHTKLKLYDKSFREIHNKIDDRMTLRNIHSRNQLPETDLRIVTETLQEYM